MFTSGMKFLHPSWELKHPLPSVTILKWEHGERKPSGAALRLLEIAKRAPEALIAR
jgi:DNA-binding transcriptional regulator YiaG